MAPEIKLPSKLILVKFKASNAEFKLQLVFLPGKRSVKA
jgi:hypothetical protein